MAKTKIIQYLFILLFLLTPLTSTLSMADIIKPVAPPEKAKCPVCGMFVAKYPNWIGEIIFTGNEIEFFDGAKDLFKYYFNLKKYNPEKTISDIQAIYVTEYYDVDYINAYGAVFVVGSDVYGPMGRELIPFRNKADAKEFLKDHNGTKYLRFDEITPEVITGLD